MCNFKIEVPFKNNKIDQEYPKKKKKEEKKKKKKVEECLVGEFELIGEIRRGFCEDVIIYEG